MPAMNISLQRRIGKLPKSPDYLDNVPPSIFEYNHRGFGTRKPTPTSKGFFGIGDKHAKNDHAGAMAAGDGMGTAWYGNDGTRSLPVAGYMASVLHMVKKLSCPRTWITSQVTGQLWPLWFR